MENELLYVYDSMALRHEDFYQKEHSFIYEGIKHLWNARRTIDVVTLADQLQKQSVLDVVGGKDYLYELSTFLLSPSSAAEYAKIVKEKATLR